MSRLILVPTPIGHLEDITFRAVQTLKTADLILAEDTRTTGKLLKHYGIETKMRAYHQHNEHEVSGQIVQMIEGGNTVALVSDAGTPGISDPGFYLVRACIEAGVPVECLPGPVALIPALVASGIPSDRFCFEGFLPHKKGRKSRLAALAEETRTMIFYESPYRLLKTLDDLIACFGAGRKAAVAREISKIHEEYLRGSLEAIRDHYSARKVKGEIVIIVAGKPEK